MIIITTSYLFGESFLVVELGLQSSEFFGRGRALFGLTSRLFARLLLVIQTSSMTLTMKLDVLVLRHFQSKNKPTRLLQDVGDEPTGSLGLLGNNGLRENRVGLILLCISLSIRPREKDRQTQRVLITAECAGWPK